MPFREAWPVESRNNAARWQLAVLALCVSACGAPSDGAVSPGNGASSSSAEASARYARSTTQTEQPPPKHATKLGSAQPQPTTSPTASAKQSVAPPALSPDAAHPRLAQFVELVAPWDTTLADELRELDLRGSAAAPDADVVKYLEHWLLVEIAIPALRLGRRDRELASVLRALEGVGPNAGGGHTHTNLQMGPVTPSACEPCDGEPNPRCKRNACELARRRLAPAVYSAAGLNEQLRFRGHPRAMDDGVGYTGSFTLTEYLAAAVDAGLARDEVRKRLRRVLENVTRRARHYAPTYAESQTSVRLQLLEGVARWRATYAPESRATTGWEIPDGELTALALWEALSPVEDSLLGRFKNQSMVRHRRQSRRFRSETARLERELAAGKQTTAQFPQPASESDPCKLNETWDESRSSCSALMEILSDWEAVAQSLRGPDSLDTQPVGLRLALVLERLTWAKLSHSRVDALLSTWERETKRMLSESP